MHGTRTAGYNMLRSYITVHVRGMCIQLCMLRAVVIFVASIVCGAPTENAACNLQISCGKRAEQATPFTLWWTLSGVATHSDKP